MNFFQLIENKLAVSELEENNNEIDDVANDFSKSPKNFIDQTVELLKANEFNWKEAVDESNDIVFAVIINNFLLIELILNCVIL